MNVYKFGGASVKDAESVKNVAKIINAHTGNLVVVISAMGKTTNLLETLIKAYFEKSNKKWEIFGQFKNYHLDIANDLFDGNGAPESVLYLFSELESKLKKNP